MARKRSIRWPVWLIPEVTNSAPADGTWPIPGRVPFRGRTWRSMVSPAPPGRCLSRERLRPLRHDRQCLGMDDRLVRAPTPGRRGKGLLHPRRPTRRARSRELRPRSARNQDPAQGAEGRLAPLRAQLLSALPPGRTPSGAGRHFDEPCRLSLRRPRLEPSRIARTFKAGTAN